MKKAVVSLAAVLVVLASFATPSFAGQSQTQVYDVGNVRVSVTVPTTGQIGGTITARVSITVNPDGDAATRRMVGWNVELPGTASRSGFRAFPVGKTKSLVKTIDINERIPAGDYHIGVTFTADGVTRSGQLPITLTNK